MIGISMMRIKARLGLLDVTNVERELLMAGLGSDHVQSSSSAIRKSQKPGKKRRQYRGAILRRRQFDAA